MTRDELKKALLQREEEVARLKIRNAQLREALALLLHRQDESHTAGVLPADWGLARAQAREALDEHRNNDRSQP